MALQTQSAAPVVRYEHGFFFRKGIVTGTATDFAVKKPHILREGCRVIELMGVLGCDLCQ
jgi:hypothetical protein